MPPDASSRQPYTGEETRILLSFAMEQHGALFAHWLRDKLMKRLCYYSLNAVYMDCIASRGRSSEHLTAAQSAAATDADRAAGVTYVSPDTRGKFASQGYMPIGARNSEWNQMYRKAMAEARAMIMVVTPEYMNSQWCMLEWQQFGEENRRRRGAGDAPLIGVALVFPNAGGERPAGSSLPSNGADVTIVSVTKVRGLGGMLWHPDSFGISEDSFAKLIQALGPNV